MNARMIHLSEFKLLLFTMDKDGEGSPIMRTERCGSFSSAEDALEFARELATCEWRRLSAELATREGSTECNLRSTEWGYDLLDGDRMMLRFWVHDSHADEAPIG